MLEEIQLNFPDFPVLFSNQDIVLDFSQRYEPEAVESKVIK